MEEMESIRHSSVAIKRGRRRCSRGSDKQRAPCSAFPARGRGSFAAKRRSRGCVNMFRVLVDPPSGGTFFSGSEVRGRVVVDTKEEKKFKYIHISLTGRAQVRWPDSSQQRDHSAEREYLHETQMLWNREDEGGQLFPAGFHSFPFRFHLPPKIPSSFEGRVGWVRYELFSRIVTSTIKNDHTVEIDIPVMEIVDINRDQLLLVPTSTQTQKRVWSFLCTFSNVSMVVDLTRTGFCVGEDIPLNVSLENSSHHEVIIAATLRQKITYTAKRNKRQYDKATVVKVSSHPIAPRTSTIWPTNLRVPHDEATSQNYDPVHIAYSIKVVASVVWAQELVARIPITIGNIPYGESLVNFDTTTCREELQMCSHASTTSLLSGRSPHYTIHSAPAVSRSSTISVASSNLCSYESACTYSVQGCIDNKPANCHSVAWSNGPGERHSVALGNGSADLHSVARSNEAADTHSVARDESYI